MTALACQSHPFMAIIGPQSARMVIFDRIQGAPINFMPFPFKLTHGINTVGKMTAEQTMGKLQRAASKVQRKIEERKRER